MHKLSWSVNYIPSLNLIGPTAYLIGPTANEEFATHFIAHIHILRLSNTQNTQASHMAFTFPKLGEVRYLISLYITCVILLVPFDSLTLDLVCPVILILSDRKIPYLNFVASLPLMDILLNVAFSPLTVIL